MFEDLEDLDRKIVRHNIKNFNYDTTTDIKDRQIVVGLVTELLKDLIFLVDKKQTVSPKTSG